MVSDLWRNRLSPDGCHQQLTPVQPSKGEGRPITSATMCR
jgi:hypothetical protein